MLLRKLESAWLVQSIHISICWKCWKDSKLYTWSTVKWTLNLELSDQIVLKVCLGKTESIPGLRRIIECRLGKACELGPWDFIKLLYMRFSSRNKGSCASTLQNQWTDMGHDSSKVVYTLMLHYLDIFYWMVISQRLHYPIDSQKTCCSCNYLWDWWRMIWEWWWLSV